MRRRFLQRSTGRPPLAMSLAVLGGLEVDHINRTVLRRVRAAATYTGGRLPT